MLVTIIAGVPAAIPFWVPDLSRPVAEVAAVTIFPLIAVAYVYVMKGD